MKRIVIAGLAALALAGCSTSSGLLAPTVTHNGFDNARVVNLSHHSTVCESMSCSMIGVGAQWNEKYPDRAFISLRSFFSYTNMYGLKVRVDGEEFSARRAGITDHQISDYAKSETSFDVPVTLIRKIVAADQVWLRVSTPTGYQDYAIKDGAKDSRAYHALKNFLVTIDG